VAAVSGTELTLPKLGHSMVEGAIVQWLVADGARVAAGDILYLLETNKVEIEVESPASGILRIAVPAGDEQLPVGTVIGSIEEAV
jgi:pyruvate/2-oxoglutarate dehydrogenase complex dihydrolipoamide acyltransferase (E2) component